MDACNNERKPYVFEEMKNWKIEHLHVFGNINGSLNFVNSLHNGFYEYTKLEWKKANSEKNDYMGFQPLSQ